MYALLAKSLQQGKRDGIASAFEMRPFKRSSASDRRVATARIDLMTKQLFMIITEAPSAAEEAAFETRSEEHTSELQSLMRISYAVFCLKKKNRREKKHNHTVNNKHQ